MNIQKSFQRTTERYKSCGFTVNPAYQYLSLEERNKKHQANRWESDIIGYYAVIHTYGNAYYNAQYPNDGLIIFETTDLARQHAMSVIDALESKYQANQRLSSSY